MIVPVKNKNFDFFFLFKKPSAARGGDRELCIVTS